jgi:hypothetical protein
MVAAAMAIIPRQSVLYSIRRRRSRSSTSSITPPATLPGAVPGAPCPSEPPRPAAARPQLGLLASVVEVVLQALEAVAERVGPLPLASNCSLDPFLALLGQLGALIGRLCRL